MDVAGGVPCPLLHAYACIPVASCGTKCCLYMSHVYDCSWKSMQTPLRGVLR